MAWLLCDYGNVISLPQPPEVQALLAGLCGMATEEFHEAYWADRLAYDRGDLDAKAYWYKVSGKALPDELVEQMSAIDVEGWVHPNEEVLGRIDEACGRRGYQAALLSNAPAEIARSLDQMSWLSSFSPRLFSCDLRATKPDGACFTAALKALGAAPDEVVFVDDSEHNVSGAKAVGIRAVHYVGPEVFADL